MSRTNNERQTEVPESVMTQIHMALLRQDEARSSRSSLFFPEGTTLENFTQSIEQHYMTLESSKRPNSF